ncbi:MAG: hypothetical protein ACT4TC_09170, partial [Myxococcaceae bacterium]
QVFALRGELTPYLGYYYAVSLLNWLFPLTVANKIFLTAYLVGMPLSLGFLLKSLRRSTWPALLAMPFAYGDSLAWGFINYCSALPLTFLCCGLFVRALTAEDVKRWRWAAALSGCLVAVLLFHAQAFAYLGVALPVLLLMTRPSVPGWLQGRVAALAGVVPGVGLFLVWIGMRLGQPAEIEYGTPWKAWGPLLSPQNLSYKSFDQNLTEWVPALSGLLRDGSDHFAVLAVGLVGLGGLALGLWGAKDVMKQRPAVLHVGFGVVVMIATGCAVLQKGAIWRLWVLVALAALAAWREAVRTDLEEGPVERFRALALAAISVVLFLALPFDIRGYMYDLNTRFVHLATPLILAAVPVVPSPSRKFLRIAAAACAALTGMVLARGFHAFGEEAKGLETVAKAAGPKARVMGLIFDTQSGVVAHPVFLHSAAVVAREGGGYSNFSFALTPHSPLMYRDAPPPTYPSEWRPDQYNHETMGRGYDHFLLRGIDPHAIFGARMGDELTVAARSGSFFLVRRLR